jgi:hypothetical protein
LMFVMMVGVIIQRIIALCNIFQVHLIGEEDNL